MAASTDLAWYGKLPTAGDFLHRHMPDALITGWANWFKAGVAQWQQHDCGGEAFARAPIWNFALPATLGAQRVQIGCLMPSRDRVGRIWPLLATQNIAPDCWHPAQLTLAGDWFHTLGNVLHQAVSQQQSAAELERALAEMIPLPDTAPLATVTAADYRSRYPDVAWQEVSHRFDPQQYTSYWWSNQSDGYPLMSHKHSGILTARLFTQLFHPTAAAQRGRHGLYPPMFDQAD